MDLHQTARAHLYSSLLRIKPIANHEDLPEQLKKGVAKPELAEDERVVLHNVTSGLYNRDGVKKAVDKAITFVCEALDMPVPEKGKKGKRERKGKMEAPAQEPEPAPETTNKGNADEGDDETDFEGFSADEDDDDDEIAPTTEDLDSDAEVTRENDFAAMDGLLGSSDDEDEDEERARLWEKYRGKETVDLDDISVSGGDSDPEAADDDDDDDSSDDDQDKPVPKPTRTKKVTSRGVSLSPSPEPQRKRSSNKAAVVGRPTDSTFLPSLMGGYVSGSESASDVDVAPPTKRRGQRARRAIWEQKYGRNAKHLQEAAKNKGRGRDDGWDMKRGAVGDGDSRTPWKKGVKNPFASSASGGGGSQQQDTRPPPPPTKRDDEGVLHPSWEARKKAKESLKATSFSGSKVVFD